MHDVHTNIYSYWKYFRLFRRELRLTPVSSFSSTWYIVFPSTPQCYFHPKYTVNLVCQLNKLTKSVCRGTFHKTTEWVTGKIVCCQQTQSPKKWLTFIMYFDLYIPFCSISLMSVNRVSKMLSTINIFNNIIK